MNAKERLVTVAKDARSGAMVARELCATVDEAVDYGAHELNAAALDIEVAKERLSEAVEDLERALWYLGGER